MNKIILALLIFASQPLFALLPPLEQSRAEIQTILNSAEISKYLPSGEKILNITAMRNGYSIHTETYVLMVHVEYEPQSQPGPANFKVTFEQPIKIES